VILLVVDADGVTDAEELALDGFNKYLKSNLTVGESSGIDGPYDYCVMMESGLGVAGSDRFTDYGDDEETAYPATSDRGISEIEDAWERTYDDFTESLERIQEMMENATVEEMANNQSLRSEMDGKSALSPNISHYLYEVNEYELDLDEEYYGSDAPEREIEVIPTSTPDDFEELMDRDLDGKWAVPMDVHY
jgi:hypothetical protein